MVIWVVGYDCSQKALGIETVVVCMCVCMHACVCVYVCMYVCMHACIDVH